MIKKKPAFAIGDSTEMMCSQCDIEQMHKVATVTKQGGGADAGSAVVGSTEEWAMFDGPKVSYKQIQY